MWGYIVRKTGKGKERENVAPRCIPRARGRVLLVRLHGHHMVLLQRTNGSVGWPFYQSKHLG